VSELTILPMYLVGKFGVTRGIIQLK